MRLLLINPNTSEEITNKVVAASRACAMPGTEIVGTTGRFGARYISDRAAYAIAGHAALDALAAYVEPCDAVVLACFGDPGLLALREATTRPVIGMAEAAIEAACATGPVSRFAIVTGGHGWVPMLEEFVAALGLAHRLAAVKAVDKTGAAIAVDPDAALAELAAACNACVRDQGADVVILGGAGLAGIAARIEDRVRVPLIDGVAVAIARAEAAVDGREPAKRSTTRRVPVETVGLAPALMAKMRES